MDYFAARLFGADRGIKDLFLDRRVNLKFRECLINDLLLRASGLRIFEPVKQVLHRIVILLQKGEGRLSLQQLKYN